MVRDHRCIRHHFKHTKRSATAEPEASQLLDIPALFETHGRGLVGELFESLPPRSRRGWVRHDGPIGTTSAQRFGGELKDEAAVTANGVLALVLDDHLTETACTCDPEVTWFGLGSDSGPGG